MAENRLRELDGKKIRRMYFTVVVLAHYLLMVFIPYCMLVFSLGLDKFNLPEWLSDLGMSIWVCFVFSIPWVILEILNFRCFGKIVCVLTEQGIYYEDGFVAWRDIRKVEYEIDMPGRYGGRRDQRCRAIIYMESKSITLFHAPLYILSGIKKFRPELHAEVSKNSKWMLAVISILTIVIVPLIPLLR